MRFTASYKIHSPKNETDWVSVQRSLCVEWRQCEEILANSSLDFHCKYSSIMAIIENCVRVHTPQPRRHLSNISNQFHARSSPWWNNECERAARLRKAAFQKFKFLVSIENFIKYRQADAITKKLFRETKRKFLRFLWFLRSNF